MNIAELYRIYLEHPSVQTDTRRLQKDDLFFALRGPSFNGNEFARQAVDAGARAAVIDDASFAIPGKTVLVDDTLDALQQLARHHRLQLRIPFLAITGSNGKTTTKELVHVVLSTSYTTYTTSGNLNNHIGVPLTILGIRGDAQIAVIEMGANHLGEIASYCRIALPTHGLITNCGKAHLEGFGSEEGVRKGKGELFDFLRENGGTAFIMKDYDYLRSMSRGIPNIITYGTSEADITGDIIAADPFLSVKFTSGFSGIVNSHLVGTYNLPNVLAAVCAGKHFTVDDEKIRSAIASYLPSNSRSQLVEKGSNRIILDAYNANPSSMKAAIENFSKAEGTDKILVLGAMAELGADSPAEHAALVDQIRKTPWKEVILVGDDFKNVGGAFRHFRTAEDAGRWMKDRVSNSFLLVKGSRSMRMEKVLEFI